MRYKKTTRILLLILVLVCASGPLLAQVLRCSKCGSIIDGKYYKASTGQIYCEKDFRKMQPQCYYCKRMISGTYYQDDGHKVCPACHEQHRVRCSKCNCAISGKYYKKNGKALCASCYDKSLPICCCCGRKISGKYHEYFGGSIACNACVSSKSMQHCIECYCPVDPNRSLPLNHYGGYLCEKHSTGAVTTNNKAQSLFRVARQNVVNAMGADMAVHSTRLEMKLVNQPTLIKVSGTNSTAIRGFCASKSLGPFVSHTIYILAGMSQNHTMAVMSHELTHAWLFENNKNIERASSIFCEGFCEWIAYRTAAVYGSKLEMERMLSNQASDDYSQGLRKFLDYEKNYGKKSTLKLGRTGTRI